MMRALILSVCLAIGGFGLWSLYVSSRYQALCEISYFSATAAEIRRCDERMAELQGR
jgi:hypothetical protein